MNSSEEYFAHFFGQKRYLQQHNLTSDEPQGVSHTSFTYACGPRKLSRYC